MAVLWRQPFHPGLDLFSAEQEAINFKLENDIIQLIYSILATMSRMDYLGLKMANICFLACLKHYQNTVPSSPELDLEEINAVSIC